MEQATRVSDRTAFFYVGDMVRRARPSRSFRRRKTSVCRTISPEGLANEHGGTKEYGKEQVVVGFPGKHFLGRRGESVISIRNFNLWYGDFQALKTSRSRFRRTRRPRSSASGCGKSTLLRTFNRMCDFVPTVRTEGAIEIAGRDIFATESNELRVMVGMVFQHPNPFPMSIRDNILYGPRRTRKISKAEGDEIVERCLRDAGLWDEAKDKLDQNGLGISGGQQQRLCIARALAVEPQVLLMDEPTSALDPISTSLIEELMVELARDRTVVVVTHNMQQATRVADKTAFFYLGELIEEGPTKQLFSQPREERTKDYLTGRFS